MLLQSIQNMMRVDLLLFLLSIADVATAFSPNIHSPPSCSAAKTSRKFVSSPFPAVADDGSDKEADEYDAWYEDFDPSTYDTYNKDHGTPNSQSEADHDYRRDTSRDNSPVDLNQVNYLMSERLHLRKTGNFDEADAIRDELLEKHGVSVQDKKRTWRSGSRRMERRGAGRPGPSARDLGPLGHDYELAKDAGPNNSSLSMDEIHNFLKERLQCKFSRNFQAADAIQRQLLEGGVIVNDASKEWRADGRTFGGFEARAYGMIGPPPPEQLDYIQDMVDQRARFKAERFYKEADRTRDDLEARFGVYIDDQSQTWQIGRPQTRTSNRRDRFQPFEMSKTSERPDNHDEIQQLVQKRDTARSNRDFDTADQIRNQLMDQEIYIDDKLRQWAVAGDFEFLDKKDPSPQNRNGQFGSFQFNRRGDGGSLSKEEEETILGMLKKRDEHKKNRKYKSADSIRDKLRDEFNVRVDDRNREWQLISEEYSMSGESLQIAPEIQKHIEQEIKKRAMAKAAKDYETADKIRDELMQDYSVSIDDRRQEWVVADDDFDDPPPGTTLQMEYVEEDDEVVGEDRMVAGVQDSVEEEKEDSLEKAKFEETFEEEEEGKDDNEEDLEKLTIPELKDRLREANLAVSGKKSELIERLKPTAS